MERERAVLDKQRTMQQAGAMAIDAIRSFSDASIGHAEAMAGQAGAQAEQCVRTFNVTLDSDVSTSAEQRQSLVTGFSYYTSTKIVESGLSTDAKLEAQRYANNCLTQLNNRHKTDSSANIYQKDSARRTVDAQYDAQQRVVSGRLADIERRSNNRVGISSGADNYVSTITAAITDLETLIDQRQLTLDETCKRKILEIRASIGNRNQNMQAQTNAQKALFESKFATLVAKNAKSNSSQQGSNQNNTDNQDGARRRTPPASDVPQKDPRIAVLMGRSTGEPERPFKVLLANIDHHRQLGKTDFEIYRLLVRHFHPDTSSHEEADAIARVLTGAYDKATGKFKV